MNFGPAILVAVAALSAGGCGTACEGDCAAPPDTTWPEATVPDPLAAPGSGLVVLGDSLTVESREAIAAVLPGATIDAVGGRTIARSHLSDAGLDRVAELRQAGPTQWVVALGTNDAAYALRPDDEIRADVTDLLDAIGPDACVLWVLPYVVDPVPQEGIDRASAAAFVIAEQVGRLACRAVVPWGAAVTAEPGLIEADGVHLTELGRQRFAAAIADAVTRLAVDR